MSLFLSLTEANPYASKPDYQLTHNKTVRYANKTWTEQIYTKKLNIRQRIGKFALSVIPYITGVSNIAIMPILHNTTKLYNWQQEAITGKQERKVYLEHPEINVENEKLQQLPSVQMRGIPTLSLSDTIAGAQRIVTTFTNGIQLETLIFQSTHCTKKKLFQQNEIISIEKIVKMCPIGNIQSMNTLKSVIGSDYGSMRIIMATKTKHNKWIIQQQAIKSGAAAVIAMLMMDHGKQPNISTLTSNDFNDSYAMIKDLKKSGLNALRNQADSINSLGKALLQYGSAIVRLLGPLNDHVILVDEISENLNEVRLRDPYHGWEITVEMDAFLQQHPDFESFIQIQKSVFNRLSCLYDR